MSIEVELNIYNSIMTTELEYIDSMLKDWKINWQQHALYADKIIRKRDIRTRETVIRHNRLLLNLIKDEK